MTPYDEIIVPELLPPSEDGVFKTLMTHPDAKPILRDVVESYLHIPVVNVEVRNSELPIAVYDKLKLTPSNNRKLTP